MMGRVLNSDGRFIIDIQRDLGKKSIPFNLTCSVPSHMSFSDVEIQNQRNSLSTRAGQLWEGLQYLHNRFSLSST